MVPEDNHVKGNRACPFVMAVAVVFVTTPPPPLVIDYC
jgi:hypothetical protein